MKNQAKLVILAVCVGLFTISCNNDDSNGGETLIPLTGKWSINKIGTTTAGVETLVDAPQNQTGCDKDYIDLKLDNTIITGNYDSTISACALFTDNGIYSRSHNNLTRVIGSTTIVQDIENLTLHELKLKDASGNIEVFIR
jgi:hypothetical protein